MATIDSSWGYGINNLVTWSGTTSSNSVSGFKVGDKVRILSEPDNNHEVGDVGKITLIDSTSGISYPIKVVVSGESGDYAVNELEIFKGDEMNVVKKLKDLALNKDERLLRKYGIVSECGEITSEGKEVLWALLLDANRETLVAKVKALDTEEKKGKK